MKDRVRRIFADLIGLVFLFSSITKLIDPVGTGLIVDSYLSHMSLDFLRPASRVLGMLLSLSEAFVAISLLTLTFRRFTAWFTTVLTAFFTVISIWLAISKPDISCGCFGQVLILTHTQTLIKNIILCLFCIPAFFPYKNLDKAKVHRYVAFGIGSALMLAFSILSAVRQPMMEFSEFKASASIVAPSSQIVDGEAVLPVWDGQGTDCSELILDSDVAILSFYDPSDVEDADILSAASFAQDAFNAGYTPVVLSAGELEIPGVEVYMSDYKKLITLNRSNGGLTFLHDGYIYAKYNAGDYLSFDSMDKLIGENPIDVYIEKATDNSVAFYGFLIALLAILVFV